MEERKQEIRNSICEWSESIAFAVIAVVLTFTFLFRVVGVDGRSMEPTLHDNDFILISNLLYAPKNGDIVVITPTVNLNVPIVKRVIATAGQRVDIHFDTGDIMVDNQILKEPYIAQTTHSSRDIVFPQTVPNGCIFVMGDNRNNSLDSRDSSIGMVDTRYVLGRVWLRLLPLRSVGPVR